ncbi:hypothetical protein D8Y22_02440 [Salinadaptatus halalkaliphilus]|uniref:Uncharacterized protein n=1 Tax=Salinadaptatus halalkaliphilus TaxID=2419781 RepID=A0A4S3TUT7_9EURY|nr:hypothetical protein [Salinadaptatus halalkaliphilus]THE66438.1 hypothetical protein D8Y22_02440 [Salinadaptatus halalkaliphilus]
MSGDYSARLVQRLTNLRDGLEPGMDRREFLRTVVSGGYVLGVASYLGVEDFLSADEGEVPIVTALVRSDPDDPFSLEERTRDVPAEWYAAVTKALEINEYLATVGMTGYLGSAVVPGSYSSQTASVSVGISSEGRSTREMIEEIADGISINAETIVEVEEMEDGPPSTQPRVATNVDSGVAPSGVVCETPSSMATLAPALYDPNTEQSYFVTAEHAFEGVSDPVGEPLVLPIDSAEPAQLGAVEYAYPVEDVAVVTPNGDLEPSSTIDTPSSARVRGQYTRLGLADLVARDEYLEKVGALTGHTTGRIQGIDAVTCFTDTFCRRGQIRWGGEMDLTDGDSGSVSFHEDPQGAADDVLVAGFNNARTWWPGQSYVWGIGAYKLTETHGYHF